MAPRHANDLLEVVQGLQARDLAAPVVVRFSDILAHRLRHLNDAFARAISESEYRNRYAAVFPIKVNQQRLVVDEVYRYGRKFGFGLEVGSKPELLAVMADQSASDRLIVCNGFKIDTSRRHPPPSSGAPSFRWWKTSPSSSDPAPRQDLRGARGSACASSWPAGFGPARLGRREKQVRPVRHGNHRAAQHTRARG
jgi:hypothetical protein